MTKRYNQTKSEIEDIRNSLREIGNQERWFEWIENFGNYINSKRDIPDTLKKELLKTVLDFISVDYDNQEKVHRLIIHFKLPVFQHVKEGKNGNGDKYFISKSLETLGNRSDQNTPVTYYSTVVECSPKGSNQNQYSLRLSVELTFSNLWTSPYSIHQQELYGIICKYHDEEGWNFKQISDWFNENNYLTPRGKVFKENHVWSIYEKKMRSIKRFSREYDHRITDMKVDVVGYRPSTE